MLRSAAASEFVVGAGRVVGSFWEEERESVEELAVESREEVVAVLAAEEEERGWELRREWRGRRWPL